MAKIVVSGYMIRHPVVGNQLAYLQYVLGLHRLGHEVCYVEESGWPDSCYDRVHDRYTSDPRTGMTSLQELLESFGLAVAVAYVDRETGAVHGSSRETVERWLSTSDLWLNIGGVCMLPEFELCRRRVLIDMDPLFTQAGAFGGDRLTFYHDHFSYGTNLGSPQCEIPTGNVQWRPLPPPVVPDVWQSEAPTSTAFTDGPFTTIANWSAYGSIEWNGRTYGQKDREFLRFIELPLRCNEKFTLALASEGPAARELLQRNGWSVVSAAQVSQTRQSYAEFIAASAGEFSAAKHAYVVTRSGWLSDRSVCYLAMGRPVVVQDTAAQAAVETGRGMLVFSTLEEAVSAFEILRSDYQRHCQWARALANDVFSYKVVLPKLLDTVLATPRTPRQASSAAVAARP